MRFREHRGGLAESMATEVELAGRDALVVHVRALLELWGICVRDCAVHVEPYAYDERVGWDTYIVTLDGYGVVGFTDGPSA